MPSLLRIVGLVLAVLLILVATRRLRRRGTGSRVPAATLLLIGLGLWLAGCDSGPAAPA